MSDSISNNTSPSSQSPSTNKPVSSPLDQNIHEVAIRAFSKEGVESRLSLTGRAQVKDFGYTLWDAITCFFCVSIRYKNISFEDACQTNNPSLVRAALYYHNPSDKQITEALALAVETRNDLTVAAITGAGYGFQVVQKQVSLGAPQEVPAPFQPEEVEEAPKASFTWIQTLEQLPEEERLAKIKQDLTESQLTREEFSARMEQLVDSPYLDLRDDKENTILHFLAEKGRFTDVLNGNIREKLLKFAQEKNSADMTPIDLAYQKSTSKQFFYKFAAIPSRQKEIIRAGDMGAFMQEVYSPYLPVEKWREILDMAVTKPEMFRSLLDLAKKDGKGVEALKALDDFDDDRNSVFHVVCKEGYLEIAQIIKGLITEEELDLLKSTLNGGGKKPAELLPIREGDFNKLFGEALKTTTGLRRAQEDFNKHYQEKYPNGVMQPSKEASTNTTPAQTSGLESFEVIRKKPKKKKL